MSLTATPRPSQMLRLNLAMSPQGGVVVLSKNVARNSMNRRDPHRNSETFALALDRDGKVLSKRGFRLETERRSETEGPDGAMWSERVEVEHPVFTLTIPFHPDMVLLRLMRVERGQPNSDATLLGEVVP